MTARRKREKKITVSDVASLKWFVIRFDPNKNEMCDYNIFNHGSFCEFVKNTFELYKNDPVAFKDNLRKCVLYFFWAKCEYEIIISEWPPRADGKNCSKKIDIYEQVIKNFALFADYVWTSLKSKSILTESVEPERIEQWHVSKVASLIKKFTGDLYDSKELAQYLVDCGIGDSVYWHTMYEYAQNQLEHNLAEQPNQNKTKER